MYDFRCNTYTLGWNTFDTFYSFPCSPKDMRNIGHLIQNYKRCDACIQNDFCVNSIEFRQKGKNSDMATDRSDCFDHFHSFSCICTASRFAIGIRGFGCAIFTLISILIKEEQY